MVERRVQRKDMPGCRIIIDRKILVRPPSIVKRLKLASTRMTLWHLDRYSTFNLIIDISRGTVRHVPGSAVQRFDGDVKLGQGNFPDRIALEGRVGMRTAVDAGVGCVLVGEEA